MFDLHSLCLRGNKFFFLLRRQVELNNKVTPATHWHVREQKGIETQTMRYSSLVR